jgi:hypothetical protein
VAPAVPERHLPVRGRARPGDRGPPPPRRLTRPPDTCLLAQRLLPVAKEVGMTHDVGHEILQGHGKANTPATPHYALEVRPIHFTQLPPSSWGESARRTATYCD